MPLMASLWLPHAPGANIYTDLQTGSQKWDNPYFVQALTEEAAIAKYIEPTTGVSWEGMPAAFTENKAPMLLDGSWDLATVQKANPSIKLGSFPLPGSNIASQNLPLVQPDLNLEVLRQLRLLHGQCPKVDGLLRQQADLRTVRRHHGDLPQRDLGYLYQFQFRRAGQCWARALR